MTTDKCRYVMLPLAGIQRQQELWLHGQLLRSRVHYHLPPEKGEEHWKNIIRILSAYLPGKIESGLLEIESNQQVYQFPVEKNGSFSMVVPVSPPNGKYPDLHFHLLHKHHRYRIHQPAGYEGSLFCCRDFVTGVISDIDDTILVSHTRNSLKRIRHLFIKNSLRRKAVREMAELYQHLHQRHSAVFYVSNSEANLYPMIRQFMKHHGFPEGPIFLKPYKSWKNFAMKNHPAHQHHKMEKIRFLLEMFPEKKFLLIGDDTQKDPEIYTSITAHFPERISGILVRNVRHSVKPAHASLRDSLLESTGIQTCYFKNPVQLYENLIKQI